MFDRAQSRLILLKETEEVTARDILDVFRDLCSDVSQDGKKVEKLPPGDEEELVSNICFIARMISRIYTENETIFSDGQQKSRWERVRERFQQVVKAADEAEAMETRIHDLKEETEAKEKQYEKLFSEMKAKEAAFLGKQQQLEKDLEASAKEQELLQQKRKQELEQKEQALREKIRREKEQNEAFERQLTDLEKSLKEQEETKAGWEQEIRKYRDERIPAKEQEKQQVFERLEEIRKEYQTLKASEEDLETQRQEILREKAQQELKAAGVQKEKEAAAEAVLRLQTESQTKKKECEELESQKVLLAEEVRKLSAEKEMKRLEYQKISEQKTGAEQELKKLEEDYRLPLENMEKRQMLLEQLFRNMTGDAVLMGDWNRGSWNGEKDQLKRLLEQSRSRAEAELEHFSGAYQTLVKFLEEGGF